MKNLLINWLEMLLNWLKRQPKEPPKEVNFIKEPNYDDVREVMPAHVSDELSNHIARGARVFKKLQDEENERIEMWYDTNFYNDLVAVVKKHFGEQNDKLKTENKSLGTENRLLTSRNNKLKKENGLLRQQINVEVNEEII